METPVLFQDFGVGPFQLDQDQFVFVVNDDKVGDPERQDGLLIKDLLRYKLVQKNGVLFEELLEGFLGCRFPEEGSEVDADGFQRSFLIKGDEPPRSGLADRLTEQRVEVPAEDGEVRFDSPAPTVKSAG
jgi:hypothetical protein